MLIVQDDRFDATESVVVVPMTTRNVQATPDARPDRGERPVRDRAGQLRDGGLITTVRRTSLGARLGRATAAQVVEVERSLLVFLGIAG